MNSQSMAMPVDGSGIIAEIVHWTMPEHSAHKAHGCNAHGEHGCSIVTETISLVIFEQEREIHPRLLSKLSTHDNCWRKMLS